MTCHWPTHSFINQTYIQSRCKKFGCTCLHICKSMNASHCADHLCRCERCPYLSWSWQNHQIVFFSDFWHHTPPTTISAINCFTNKAQHWYDWNVVPLSVSFPWPLVRPPVRSTGLHLRCQRSHSCFRRFASTIKTTPHTIVRSAQSAWIGGGIVMNSLLLWINTNDMNNTIASSNSSWVNVMQIFQQYIILFAQIIWYINDIIVTDLYQSVNG